MRSPEGVELVLPVATPAPRMAAYAFDFVLVMLLMMALLVLTALSTPALDWASERMKQWAGETQSGHKSDALLAAAPLIVFMLVVWGFSEVLYFGLWETLTRGLTPGKYLMRLRVVGAGGQPLQAHASLTRNVLRVVDILPGSYAFGLICMVMSRHYQRLGDHAGGTIVIRTDRVERPEAPEFPRDIEPLPLSREQMARLGEREILLARGALRRFDTAPDAPYEVLAQAAAAIATRLSLPSEEMQNPRRLLQRVLLTAQRER